MIFGVTTFVPLLWQARGHGLVAGSAMIAILLVVGISGNHGGGHIADRVGWRPVLLGSTSLVGAAVLAAFLVSSGVCEWFLLGMLGIMLFATLPLSVLMAQEMFPENRSFGSGIVLGLCNGLAAIGMIGLGAVADHDGILAVLWVLVIAFVLSAILKAAREFPSSSGDRDESVSPGRAFTFPGTRRCSAG